LISFSNEKTSSPFLLRQQLALADHDVMPDSSGALSARFSVDPGADDRGTPAGFFVGMKGICAGAPVGARSQLEADEIEYSRQTIC
jgi:hypothetical protein